MRYLVNFNSVAARFIPRLRGHSVNFLAVCLDDFISLCLIAWTRVGCKQSSQHLSDFFGVVSYVKTCYFEHVDKRRSYKHRVRFHTRLLTWRYKTVILASSTVVNDIAVRIACSSCNELLVLKGIRYVLDFTISSISDYTSRFHHGFILIVCYYISNRHQVFLLGFSLMVFDINAVRK